MLGQTLGHYRILQKVGAGGMGEVYLAHDEQLRRDVAIKMLLARSPGDDSARKLLIREARTASALNHPNICTIHAVEEIEGQHFIVMEYVKGRSLAEVIPSDGLAASEVLRYGEQVADALAHAHEHGVIHRDLKTSNIMITPEGRAKVLDFGLARRHSAAGLTEQTLSRDSLEGATSTGGTIQYTAPEIFRGQQADERSDIWALGIVLYEMAAGTRPFDGTTAFQLSSHIMNREPRELPAEVSPPLRAVINKCLAKSPSERYQHASEARAALAVSALGVQPPFAAQCKKKAFAAGKRNVGLLLAAAFCGLLLLAAGWRWAPGRWRLRGANAGPIRSLAVLPLANLSGNPSEEYFADGMTEELTTQLAQISALRVISRTSAMQYRDTNKSLPLIAKELDVDAVVEGSVTRSGDKVRITAELIQASTDRHLWAKSYEGDSRDVLGLQQDVAKAIADEVKVQLTPQEQTQLSNPRPVNPAAHEAYLKGTYLNKRTGAPEKKAREYFEEAIKIDPNYAPAYAGLSEYYWSNPNLRPREAMPKAKQYALKAIALDPAMAQSHYELAGVEFYGDWDWPSAEQEFRRALALNPNDVESHRLYSVFLSALGRKQDALVEVRKAQELDPLSIQTQLTVGFVLYFAREFDESIEQCHSVLELDPNAAGTYDCMGSSYLGKGVADKAITEFERASTLSNKNPVRLSGLGQAYARAQRNADARRVLEELREVAKHEYVPPYFFATIYGALGEKDEAFKWLETAFDERDIYLAWLKVDAAVDPLRSDQRFAELLHRVGFDKS